MQYLEEQLLQNTKIRKEKIRRIPLSIEVSPFIEASAKDKLKAREAFSLQNEDFIVGVIGRLDKQKGQEYLIKALPLIKDQIPNLRVLLIGEETYGEEGYLAYLKDLVNSLKVEDLVIFQPFTQDTPTAFRALDIFMMSSISEPFGMVTVEAMATGTPVIGTNSGGTAEILEGGNLGVLVEPKDEKAIAEAILKLYTDETLRENFSKQAQKKVQEKYSHLTQCALFEKTFNELEQ
ncbi:MAG: glycosyltransferase family 4 protein [Chloroflexia bacterium]|nr:glycosyltransferase family 4 protein [Chloroflexia bacterium]